jgi:hypothetical protein
LKQLTSVRSSRATFSVDFTDQDGNLTGGWVNVSYQYKTGQRSYSKAVSIPSGLKSISGSTSGTVTFVVKFRSWKAAYKSFSFSLYLTDNAKLNSNALSLTVVKNKAKRGGIPNAEGPQDEE